MSSPSARRAGSRASRAGISLVESLFTIAVLMLTLVGTIQALVHFRFLSALTRERMVAIGHLQSVVECLRATPANGWGQPLPLFPSGVQDWGALQATCGVTAQLPNEQVTVLYTGLYPAGVMPVTVQWTTANDGAQTLTATVRRFRNGL